MKIGDLVKYKKEHPYKNLGIIIEVNWEEIDPCQYPAAKIMWSDDCRPFWTRVRELELLNESR
jgi:hypothetical protein